MNLGKTPGADLGFSRGGADFQKKNRKFFDFELSLSRFSLCFGKNFCSQSTVLPLFRQNFLRRRQIFEKQSKSRFWALFEKF